MPFFAGQPRRPQLRHDDVGGQSAQAVHATSPRAGTPRVWKDQRDTCCREARDSEASNTKQGVEENVDGTFWRESRTDRLVQPINHLVGQRAFASEQVGELVGRQHVAGGFGREEVSDPLIKIVDRLVRQVPPPVDIPKRSAVAALPAASGEKKLAIP